MGNINNQTQLFTSCSAKPGNFGATIFNSLFRHFAINAVYLPRAATSARDVAQALRTFQVAGSAISMPLKESMVEHLDVLDDLVQSTRSVNTIKNQDGQLWGYNTDATGLLRCLEDIHRLSGPIQTLLIYGSGGVVPSLIWAAKQWGVEEIALTGRNKNQVELKAREFRIQQYSEGAGRREFDLLVNATPSGQRPGDEVLDLLPRARLAMDLILSPEKTFFLQEAERLGKKAFAGTLLGKYQLQEQFTLYTGREVEIELIEQFMVDYFAGRGTSRN